MHASKLGIVLGRIAFKLMVKLTLKPMFKTIAHGPELRHSPQQAEMWEPHTAYSPPAPPSTALSGAEGG
jgi:hypothetical protein